MLNFTQNNKTRLSCPKTPHGPGWGGEKRWMIVLQWRRKPILSTMHYSDGKVHPELVSSCSAPGPGAESPQSELRFSVCFVTWLIRNHVIFHQKWLTPAALVCLLEGGTITPSAHLFLGRWIKARVLRDGWHGRNYCYRQICYLEECNSCVCLHCYMNQHGIWDLFLNLSFLARRNIGPNCALEG